MLRWLAFLVIIASTIAVAWSRGEWFEAISEEMGNPSEPVPVIPPPVEIKSTEAGPPLYEPKPAPTCPVPEVSAQADPIILRECRVDVIDRQDVPSPRDGILLFIGTEIAEGEEVAEIDRVSATINGAERTYRRLKVGDQVEAGQLLAYIDDRITRDEWSIKQARIAASEAELAAALKISEELKHRYDTQLRLRQRGVAAEEEVRRAKLSWDNAALEAVAKRQAVELAQHELGQVETVLKMHEIRASLPGVIKTLYRNPREAVKSFEPLLRIHSLERVRVEGLVDVQHLPGLELGMEAFIEPAPQQGARFSLSGHLQEVTGVTFTPDGRIVSASRDGVVRVWDQQSRRELARFKQPTAITCLACSATAHPFVLTGDDEGNARLWDLDPMGPIKEPTPFAELSLQHKGALTSVAFSPDGLSCATAGEDRDICVWNTGTGELRYRIEAAHRGSVTSLAFTPACQLVSAGQDQTIKLWYVGVNGAGLDNAFERRSGHVPAPGVSPDGGSLLFDDGDKLRLLSLPDGGTRGELHAGAGQTFARFARFSPSGQLIVTASSGDGPLQLWNVPEAGGRAALIGRLMIPAGVEITCVAFGKNDAILAAGTSDRRILIYSPLASVLGGEGPGVRGSSHEGNPPSPSTPLPPEGGEGRVELKARVTLLDTGVETSAAQVRVWAELPNAERRLLPGTGVTMVLYPR